MASEKRIVIAGAGLAGSLLACLLARRGHRVSVHERRPDPRAKGFIGGRSINLALSVRGLTALERAGLSERVLDDVIAMPKRLMHAPDGTLTPQPYSSNPDEAINSVSRGGLNLRLIDAAAKAGADLHFAQSVEDVELETGTLVVREADGSIERVTGDLLVGADGAFSAVRARMQKTARFDYSQTWLPHGYKELTIPATADGDFAMDPHALHIWPRGGSMMIALPNPDRTFTCTLFWPYAGPHGFDRLDPAKVDDDAILAFFRTHYGDAVPLMPTLVEDYRQNPLSPLVTIRCAPWDAAGRVVLLGDASHAIVPFYGQGMNAAFEDVRILDEMLAEDDDVAAVIDRFSRARKPNADAIADLALDNFIEMRDRVASPVFLARKKIEKVLHKLLPGTFVPLYNLVSFSNVPYAEAQERGRQMHRWVTLFAVGAAALVLIVAVTLVAVLLSSLGGPDAPAS